MLGTDLMPRTHQSALQNGEGVLDGIALLRVNVANSDLRVQTLLSDGG